jgi:hypothetical protein
MCYFNTLHHHWDYLSTEAPTGGPTESSDDSPTERPTGGPTDSSDDLPTLGPTTGPTESSDTTPTEGPTGGPSENDDSNTDLFSGPIGTLTLLTLSAQSATLIIPYEAPLDGPGVIPTLDILQMVPLKYTRRASPEAPLKDLQTALPKVPLALPLDMMHLVTNTLKHLLRQQNQHECQPNPLPLL